MKTKSAKLKIKGKDRLEMLSDITTMLKSGIPILDAVISLEKDSRGNVKKVLRALKNGLYNGESLAKIFGKFPLIFDDITINLIRAAESGGTLETTMQDIVDTGKKELNFSDQLRNTMIYPLFVLVVFVGIVILVLAFVMPHVSKVFESINAHMPLITRVMLAASAFFVKYWIPIIIAFVLLVTLLVIFFKTHKRMLVRLTMSLPFLHKLGRNIDYARFMRSFGLLMRAGVPILEALKLSEPIVQKKDTSEVVHQMSKDVANGKPLAASLVDDGATVPAVMERSLKTAEESGTLDEALQNLAEYFDDQVASSLKVIGSIVEPVMIVVVGAMVGTLMISVIAPVYGMIGQLTAQSSTQTEITTQK